MRMMNCGERRLGRRTAGIALTGVALVAIGMTGCSNSNERETTAWQPSNVERPQSAAHAVLPDPTRPGSIAALKAQAAAVKAALAAAKDAAKAKKVAAKAKKK